MVERHGSGTGRGPTTHGVIRSRIPTRRAAGRAAGLAAALVLAAALGACSSTDEFFSGQPAPSEKSGSPGFADRFRNLFGSGSEAQAAGATAAQAGQGGQGGGGSTLSALEVDCPSVDIRQGASTLQMNAPGSDQALGLRYQASFGRTARQCSVNAGTLSIKIGVQGRLILGPAGAPGETQIPLRYALVREGIEPKTVWSKLYILPVSLPPGQPNVPFTHVSEDLAVPVPSQADLDKYVIYVGFDPQGLPTERKPARKPRG